MQESRWSHWRWGKYSYRGEFGVTAVHLDPIAHDVPAILAEQVVWTSSRRDRICGNQVLTHLRKIIFPIRRPLSKVGMRVSGHQPLTNGSRMKLAPRS